MRTNPLNWQLAQLQTVARQNGIDWRHEGTSHCVFVRNDGKTLSVPARRPIAAAGAKMLESCRFENVEGKGDAHNFAENCVRPLFPV